jgi:hypothetical protein
MSVMQIEGLFYGVWCRVSNLLAGGDKSADPVAVETFSGWRADEDKLQWQDIPERQERWHVHSVIIRE